MVANRNELKDAVLAELEGGARKFLVDFARTGYIDSSGLGALVSLAKKVREDGGELRLSGLNADLRSLFVTASTGLYRIPTLVAGARPRRRGAPPT